MKRANNQLELKTFRRELRSNLKPAEAKLWTYLKNKQLDGRRFRRQHSVAGFILDFYCLSERLAIELDGQPHLHPAAREYDRERDLFLKYYGVLVLRFVNHLVFNNPQGVLKEIQGQFGWLQKTNSSPPAKGEYPIGGGGFKAMQAGVTIAINPSGLTATSPSQGRSYKEKTSLTLAVQELK